MTSMRKLGLVVAGSLALAAPGWTQTTSSGGTPPNAQEVQARTDARIATLHDQLHITAAEEQNWQIFTAVMKQNSAETAASLQARQKNFAGMNAVQDLQDYAALTQQQSQQIAKLVTPFQTLYAQFSPDQKATADRIFHNYTERAARRHG